MVISRTRQTHNY